MTASRKIAELGNPILRENAPRVTFPLSDEIKALIDDMMTTMIASNGVGIAAPQVYESFAIFILAPRPNPRYPDAPFMEPMVVINPEIVERSDTMVKGWEGCLSIPGIRGIVPRHQRILTRFQALDGTAVEREFVDFPARVFQHEDDHLRGIMFLDRIEHAHDLFTEREYEEEAARAKQAAEAAPPQ